jgi:tRNA threonylcarbamoyladenosine biosynthesis protein TsaE
LSAHGGESIIPGVNDPALQQFLADTDATEQLGRALAATRPQRAVAYLRGELGAGKSTLARATLRALGVTGPIRSPTYTLVERYPLADGGEAVHLDLYRIGHADELEFLGLGDADPALWLVEWPERGTGGLPGADLVVELAIEGAGRSARLRAESSAGRGWLSRLEEVGRLHAVSSVI